MLLLLLIAAPLSPHPVTAAPPDRLAIIRRHDRPDERYIALGQRYPAVGKVGRRMGDGTLIGDRWVLTAGHVANGLMRRGGEPTVYFGDRAFRVRRAYLHPAWQEMNPHDIAVLELESPVTGIQPLGLYTGRKEQHQIATLVGHGQYGTGNNRERQDDDQKRGATNRIERVTADQIVFCFDAPPHGTDLEGIPGAGDSGGPALITVAGVPLIAGVSSAGQPGDLGPGTYGALDYFTRVSTHASWVKQVLEGKVAPSEFSATASNGNGPVRTRAITPLADEASGNVAIPDSPAGKRLTLLTALMLQGDTTKIEPFLRENVAPENITPARIAAYRSMMGRYRGGTLAAILLAEPYHVDAMIRTNAGDMILGVEVDKQPPHFIRGVLEGKM